MTSAGLQPLGGLSGLSFSTINPDPEASPEEMQGGTVDEGHSAQGLQPEPWSWQIPQFGPLDMVFGTDVTLVASPVEGNVFSAGGPSDNQDPAFDRTPYTTHAAPWPKNPAGDGSVSPDNTAAQLVQSAVIHGVKTNASGRMTYATGLNPRNDEWREYDSVTPGTSLQPTGVPQAVGTTVGGFGSRDVVNSHAPQNEYGFDSAHLHRREAVGHVEGNYMWMQPGSRPLIRSLPGAMRLPVGPMSPFTAQNPAEAYAPGQGVLTQIPQEYTAVPQPDIQPLVQDQGGSQPGYDEWS